MSVAKGTAREIACFGARGDGKTWGALWAMVLHAVAHQTAGHPLPTIWLAVRDTFRNHVLSTHKSLTEPAWEGRWRLTDGGHRATFIVDGLPLVQLELVGLDSPGDAERARTQCHGIWFDEAAPAMMLSAGISEDLWSMAMSSQRLPTHARVAMLTTNLPDSEHWTAQRFHVNPVAGSMCFRIPAGERASAEYRAELMVAYANRPDLLRRLVLAEFGAVILGEQVAVGFNYDAHVAVGRRLAPARGSTLWLGQDGGLTPTTIIGQRVFVNGTWRVQINAALASKHDGIRQHMKNLVLPWLGEHAPWFQEDPSRIQVRYDPALDTDEQADIEVNPMRVMRSLLQATYRPGPVDWQGRINPLLSLLGSRDPMLEVDPISAAGLVKALDGGWYYPTGPDGKVTRDLPKKPNHPHEDHGDALCYLIAGMAPAKTPIDPRRLQRVAHTEHNVFATGRGLNRYAVSRTRE